MILYLILTQCLPQNTSLDKPKLTCKQSEMKGGSMCILSVNLLFLQPIFGLSLGIAYSYETLSCELK